MTNKQFDDKQNGNTFKNFYSKPASDIVEKLSTTKNIFRENFFLSSKFPLSCRTGRVKPVCKKSKNTEPKNYRPVSLLPILSKMIERVVYNQLIEHLEKHDIVYVSLVFESNTQ